MRGTLLVARRDFSAYFNSLWGYVVMAFLLVVNGLLFNTVAMGRSARPSTQVLEQFFYISFGTTVIAAVLITMRLLAEERQQGTQALLDSCPLSDRQIVLGKYLSAMGFLSVITLATVYMPALIFINGKVSLGHIIAGYTGLLMVGSATVAIGTFGSSVARNQLEAAAVSGFVVIVMLVMWQLARLTDAPFTDLFSQMSLYDKHFQPFQRGRVNLSDVTFYLSTTFLFLTMSIRLIETRRWR